MGMDAREFENRTYIFIGNSNDTTEVSESKSIL